MALSPENTARLQLLNRKALDNTATLDELKEGVAILQQDRIGASHASNKSKTSAAAAKVVVDPAAVLANLRNLGAKLMEGPVA